MEQDKSLISNNYINTPFAYARLLNKYNRHQLHLLLRVSDRLQEYIKKFYGSDLKDSEAHPKPLFSEEDKSNMERIVVNFSELGITTNNIPNVQEKINEALELVLRRPKLRNNGVLDFVAIPAFTHIETDREHQQILFKINMDIADELFDMSFGYISHPDDIALLANVEKMPCLYFYLRHQMLNWKKKVVKVSTFDLKDALGLVIRNEKNEITKIKYPRFFHFKQRVIDPAIEDLDRLKSLGQIDKSFSVEYEYEKSKKRGDPDWIVFSIKEENAPKETEPTQTELHFSEEEKQQEVKPSGMSWLDVEIDKKKRKEMDCWLSFLLHYNGKAKDLLTMTQFHGFIKDNEGNDLLVLSYADDFEDKWRNLKLTREETIETWKEFVTHFKGIKFKGIRRYVPKN